MNTREKLIELGSRYDTFLLLDSNDIAAALNLGEYDWIAAIGAREILQSNPYEAFIKLREFHQGEWIFGYLGYDLKNGIEKLSSRHVSKLEFPDLFFFKPKHIIWSEKGDIHFSDDDIQKEFNSCQSYHSSVPQVVLPHLQQKISREAYIEKVAAIRQHIIDGDAYELNLCMEFFTEDALIDPLEVWLRLNEASPTPFSACLKHDNINLACASPERFLRKEGSRIYAQPIKGTIRRSEDPELDEQLINELYHNEKERSENVMIVDLLRNDLARSGKTGSVKVEELFGIYSFRHLHQMISTVSAEIRDDVYFTEILRNAFPMGSMTGCPKIEAMQLIDQYEESRRGLYSGSIGYVKPNGDFDFNVVIRSLFYNSNNRYLSFQVGSAITYGSEASHEYEECLLKASAIRKVLNNSH